MQKTILITGSTDGIGLETARMLLSQDHNILLHGRNPEKLNAVEKSLSALSDKGSIECYMADLSRMADVEKLAKSVLDSHSRLDVLINNAGVLRTSDSMTQDGLDTRFAVNTIAPYLLTKCLLPLLGPAGRIINLSSAAQSPVNPETLSKPVKLSEMEAYSQSKLAITMWSRAMGLSLNNDGPVIVSVNPGSLLGTKMVKEGFGVSGGDIRIGADILTRAALSDEFSESSGLYYDNDAGKFSDPHPDALDTKKCNAIISAIEELLNKFE